MKVLFAFVLVLLPSIVPAFNVGDHVIARWKNNKYFPGTVKGFAKPDGIEILFDNGNKITHGTDDESAVIYDSAPEDVYVGQHVIATWEGSNPNKFYIGYVTEERDDGKFKVTFDDNYEDYYNADDLREFPDHKTPHEVGARVFARWINGNYYRGFVVPTPGVKHPTYVLEMGPKLWFYRKADTPVTILFDVKDTIKLPMSDSAAVILDALPPKTDFAPAKRVIAFWPDRKQYYPGVIEYDKVYGGSKTLYHVKFDDGDERDEEFYQMRILPA